MSFFRKALVAIALLVPAATAPAMAGGMHKAASSTVVDVAVSNPDFSTLVTALKAADLVDALNGPGQFTVFAPTNAAFAALPPGALDNLLKPENKAKLQAVLKYHVIPARIESAALATLQGGTLAIDATRGVNVAGANVVSADVRAGNGVIHVIDKVLLPAN
jgi:uncharacterized surface protein with fasciclin (FAS1) repeats